MKGMCLSAHSLSFITVLLHLFRQQLLCCKDEEHIV